MRKVVLRISKGLLIFLFIAGVLVLLIVAPIDRTPLEDQSFYQQTKQTLDTLSIPSYSARTQLQVGWATTNLTPDHNMPMAGYRPRDSFESVHDSLYARVLVINNGSATIGIVSVDLLMFPASIRDRLQKKLANNGFDFLYLGATHTHHSVGGWDESLGGKFIAGCYDDTWVNNAVQKISDALYLAKTTSKKAVLTYGEFNGSSLVENRLARSKYTESVLRSIHITRSDSSKALFYTFSAHATSISKKLRVLSADYPGEVDRLLKSNGYDFSMYMAGMVGSHRTKYLNDFNPMRDFKLIDVYSKEIVKRLLLTRYTTTIDSAAIRFATIPVSFGNAQVRLTKDWRIRSWVFNAAFDPLKGTLTFMQVGALTFIGTPCDFSGELFNKHLYTYEQPLMITSFNGDYVGYITEDEKYETNARVEVRTMNWVGPYYGKYFTDVIAELLQK